MWEFSLNLTCENKDLARSIQNTLSFSLYPVNGLITSSENGNIFSILIAVENQYEQQLKAILSSIISEIICTKFKSDFLNNYLNLPLQDKAGLFAFKKALLNFDKQTDQYIIKKALCLSNTLYLESFFAFRLQKLKEKWAELVSLSNENRDYLVCRESFIDLLKFLVDNLDICEDEISVIKEEQGYRITNCDNKYYTNRLISHEKVVSSIIDLSPQKIFLYCDQANNETNLLERIFEERIIINTKQSNIRTIKFS